MTDSLILAAKQANRSYLDEQAQAKVQALLDELTSGGLETGVQVAAYLDGKLVIDAWSGNARSGQVVDGDTLFFTFSCSKGVTATAIHQLVEAGKLDYDAPVARYWPEFAAKGKGAITIRQVMTHQAGIPQSPVGITLERLCDWEWMIHAIENLKPLWKPGTRVGYHALTYGHILGEVAQRVDGRSFGQIVQDEICRPLEIHDLFFGIPNEVESRVASVGGSAVPWGMLPSFFLIKRVIPPALEPRLLANNRKLWHAVIPAANMMTNARSLARHYAALCGDGVDGVRLLTPERTKIATTLQTQGRDHVPFYSKIPRGLGYWLGGDPGQAFGSRQTTFGHTGTGSVIAFADPEYNFAFAVLKNQVTFRDHDTDCKVAHAVRNALDIPD